MMPGWRKYARENKRTILLAAVVSFVIAYYFLPVWRQRVYSSSFMVRAAAVHYIDVDGSRIYFSRLGPSDIKAGFDSASNVMVRLAPAYFASPRGHAKFSSEIFQPAFQENFLERNGAAMARREEERLEDVSGKLAHEMEETRYFLDTHVKSDDGYAQASGMLASLGRRREETDSLRVLLGKIAEGNARWGFSISATACLNGEDGPYEMALDNIETRDSICFARNSNGKPQGYGHIPNPLFSLDSWLSEHVTDSSDRASEAHIGHLESKDGSYVGYVLLARQTGTGIMRYQDGGRYEGGWIDGARDGDGIMSYPDSVIGHGQWTNGGILDGVMSYPDGSRYSGMLHSDTLRDGIGEFYGADGSYYEGSWENGLRHGYGIQVDGDVIKAGTWKLGEFKGEQLEYSADRVYGIDIARYQHLTRKRKAASINWSNLRIRSLGRSIKRRIKDAVDYPISFAYVKCTEGGSVSNRYYKEDTKHLRKLGIKAGAYHFFTSVDVDDQIKWFFKNLDYQSGDLPPVVDLEPTDRYIKSRWGTDARMFADVQKFMDAIEDRLHVRPLLYVNQRFIMHHLSKASERMRSYELWIARYGEFKPFAHMVMWQLSCDGSVNGIWSDVDINVFNGSEERFQEFVRRNQSN